MGSALNGCGARISPCCDDLPLVGAVAGKASQGVKISTRNAHTLLLHVDVTSLGPRELCIPAARVVNKP